MQSSPATTIPETSAVPLTRSNLLHSLIRHEWMRCRRLHLGFLYAWIIGLWLLMIFNSPVWFIVFGLIFVAISVPGVAGGDVLDGTEEFFFSLPPGRNDLFLARIAVTLPTLLLFTAGGALAVGLDLPQLFWSLFASSGITEPYPAERTRFLYAFAILVPLCTYAVTFVIASLAGGRGLIGFSWLLGGAATGLVLIAGFLLEGLLWKNPNGWLTSVALILVSTLVLVAGHAAYLRKEAVVGRGRAATARSWVFFLWIGLAILFVVLLMMSLLWIRSDVQTEVRHSKEQELIRARASIQITPESDPQESPNETKAND